MCNKKIINIKWFNLAIIWAQYSLLISSHPLSTSSFSAGRIDINTFGIEDHVNRTCLTSICNETLNNKHILEIYSHMNTQADPCENFHEYACGKWQQQLQNLNAHNMMNLAHDLQIQKFVKLMQNLLNETDAQLFSSNERLAKKSIQEIEAFNTADAALQQQHDAIATKILQYYKVCKKTAENTAKLSSYVEQIQEMGLWPYTWHQQQQNWLELLGNFGRFGQNSAFLNMQVEQMNTSYHAIYIQSYDPQNRLSISEDIYEILSDYTSKSLPELQQDFVSLENDLKATVKNNCESSGVPRDAENECDLQKSYTLQDLQSQCNNINWSKYLESLLSRQLKENEQIMVDDLISIKKITAYLNQANGELLSLYILAHFLLYLKSLPHTLLEGKNVTSSEHCVLHMTKTLFLPMNWMYEQAYYKPVREESDKIIRHIFAEVKEEMLKRLNENKMNLSATASQSLKQKLKGIRLNIGNLPEQETKQFYESYLENLNITQNFYANHLNALAHFYQHQRFLSELPQLQWTSEDFTDSASNQTRLSSWHSFHLHPPHFSDLLESSPYYYCLSNIIIIPHAYLQTPFYDAHFWPSLLYGDLATTLGHELIHAFDNDFIIYDRLGNPSTVYQEIEANSALNTSMNCLKEGTSFLTERVADIGGTRLALNAFIKNSSSSAQQDNKRLFFIQFAQFFCGGVSDYEKFKSVDPYHDLDSIRLNHTLAHMPEFAQAFGCKREASMNPKIRCELW